MTVFPTIAAYDFAVSNLNRFILAPQFSGGNPILNRQKQIIGYSGGYSVVYPIDVKGNKLALKCWLSDPGNVKERYSRVKKYLQSHPISYLVDFGYVDKGIAVNEIVYPISYMEWVEGKTLSQFIDENVNNSAIINKLADRFLAMVKELHRKSISHGNLDDSNIIITSYASNLALKLVDYDSLYTPALQNWQNQGDLMGTRNYQHPKRYKKSNEEADYFSELVIYLSLLAYAESPNLWKSGQEKGLLFLADDFHNPRKSSIFHTLKSLSPRVRGLANRLEYFCYETDTNNLLPLEQLIPSDNSLLSFDSPAQPTSVHIPKNSPSQDFSQYFDTPTSKPPIPPNNNKDSKTSINEENYRVSISFPRLFSKRFDSVFLFQLYLPEHRSRVSKNIKAQFLDEPRIEFTDQSIIKIGQKIQVEFYNPHFDFSKAVVKIIDGTLTKIIFLGTPKDTCPSGRRNVRVSISNAENQQEIESFNVVVQVVDFAFDHISRPFLSKVSTIILAVGSFAMYILTFLEQIDKTIGLTSGTAAGILAIGIYASFYNLYQRISSSHAP